MAASGSNIGMMDPAYFVGRRAILNWLNETFSMNLTRIEDTASGAYACMVMDAIYPGEVPMHKVRWDARAAPDFIQNYKILQAVFTRLHIEKNIEVEKLIRGKYQDNLEFMQWLKSFYDKNASDEPYNAVERRSLGKGAKNNPFLVAAPAAGSSGAPTGRSAAPSAAPSGRGRPAARGRAGARRATGPAADPEEMERLRKQVEELQLSVEGLEKERDFYFGKLRDIEIYLQTQKVAAQDEELPRQIFKILYATEEDFVAEGEGSEVQPENTEQPTEGGEEAPDVQSSENTVQNNSST